MSIPRKSLLVASLVSLGTAGLASAQQPSTNGPSSDLNTCAAITSESERLACYDKLARRAPASAPAAPSSGKSGAPATVTQLPTSTPPQTATRAQTAPHQGSPPTAPAAAGSAVPPAIGTKEAFGLNAVEHPAAPKSAIEAITGKVRSVSFDPYGRETVALEEGPLWQLAGSDPLLASGDSVTIKRAALGSFVMTTPSGRTHRVKRVR